MARLFIEQGLSFPATKRLAPADAYETEPTALSAPQEPMNDRKPGRIHDFQRHCHGRYLNVELKFAMFMRLELWGRPVARRMTPSDNQNWIRRQQNAQRDAVRKCNDAVRRHNQEVERVKSQPCRSEEGCTRPQLRI